MAPGVDDHLHGGEEVGLLGHEQDGDAEQRHDEHEGGVHRVARRDHADGAGDADGDGSTMPTTSSGHQCHLDG